MLSAIVLLILVTYSRCQIDHVSLKNFDKYLEEHKDCLISFYEMWCKECDNFDPVFQRLAANLTKDYEGMRVAKMDTEGETEFLDLFYIKTYPALFYFHKGLPIAYRDLMDQDKIKHWIRAVRTRRPVKLESIEQTRSFTFPILYLFTADETSPRFRLIENLAKKSEDHIIFYSASRDILDHWKISTLNQLEALGLKDDRIRLTMTGDYDFTSLENFLLTSKHPLMQKYTTNSVKSLLSRGVAVLLVFGSDPQADLVRSDLQVWTSYCRNGNT
jgi:thiol-disulfide isomerase/thioredoxin